MTKELEDGLGPDITWDDETFENEVSSALISLYETKIIGQKYNHPSQRIDEAVLKQARKQGVYLPNANRIILADKFDDYYQLPTRASLSIDLSEKEFKETEIHSYRLHTYMEIVPGLPKSYVRASGGVIYKVVRMGAKVEGGVDGMVGYVTVDKEGNVHPVDFRIGTTSQSLGEPHVLEEMRFAATATLNYEVDKYHVWSIEAQESDARCTVGVDKEQIKSLLYARSLPVTATGRKRPILHLVAAHRRRIKEGVDIDIGEFLRGVKKVEMGGTVFTVGAPQQLIDRLKK